VIPGRIVNVVHWTHRLTLRVKKSFELERSPTSKAGEVVQVILLLVYSGDIMVLPKVTSNLVLGR
jgi:hypothetical protein